MKTRLLKISDLVVDEELYPRIKWGWLTAYQYAQAMRANSTFPPIMVGIYEHKKYIVDGVHRVEAKKLLKEEYIDAVVKKYDDRNQIFVDAIKMNSSHGRQLSVQEKVRIIDKLKRMNFKLELISEIVKVPLDKITVLEQRTITGPNGKPVYLKSVTMHSNAELAQLQAIDQRTFSVGREVHLLTQLIELLDSGVYNIEDQQVKELSIKLYQLLGQKLEL